MREAMIGRNRRGGFRRRAPASTGDGSFILGINGLWGWHKAGPNAEHITFDPVRTSDIRIVADKSGLGNNLISPNAEGANAGLFYQKPLILDDAEQVGAVPGTGITYQSTDAPLMRNRHNPGTPVASDVFPAGFLFTNGNFTTSGQFCFVNCFVLTRTSGGREIWGRTETTRINVNQNDTGNNFSVRIDGSTLTAISDGFSTPRGLAVVIIYRDSSNELHVISNGVETTTTPPKVVSGLFDIPGLGFDGVGSSNWDDYWLEDIMFLDSVPTAQEMTDMTNYLLSYWADQS